MTGSAADTMPSPLRRGSGPPRRSEGVVRRPFFAARRRAQIDEVVSLVIAAAGLVLLGLRSQVMPGVTLALLFCIVVTPLWLGTALQHRGHRVLWLGVLAAEAGGLALAVADSYEHLFSPANAVTQVCTLMTIAVAAGFVIWARRALPAWAMSLLLGIGFLLGIDRGSTLFEEDPWKFGFGLPITLIALGLSQRRHGRLLELLVVGVSAGVLLVSDARSAFGVLVLTGALIAWQVRPGSRRSGRSPALFSAFAALLAFGVYFTGQALLLGGGLGAATQARSVAQVHAAGSLLLGGRPELGASLALIRARPLGFGPGAIPTVVDLRTAQAGMASVGYQPDTVYVTGYLFGGHIELHSVTADLWAAFGLAGLALAALVAVALVVGVSVGTVRGSVNATAVYLGVLTLWNLGFSPIGTSYVLAGIALGLLAPAPNHPAVTLSGTTGDRVVSRDRPSRGVVVTRPR